MTTLYKVPEKDFGVPINIRIFDSDSFAAGDSLVYFEIFHKNIGNYKNYIQIWVVNNIGDLEVRMVNQWQAIPYKPETSEAELNSLYNRLKEDPETFDKLSFYIRFILQDIEVRNANK